jgi:hypothetical protein
MRATRPLKERLLAFVERDPSGCWLWTACKSERGYGRIGVGGKALRAHRVAYEIFVGPIPDGLCLDHLCRNTSCVNPEHLEPVTCKVNVQRGMAGQNKREAAKARTHCLLGHELTPENTLIRFSGHGAWRFRACRICHNEQTKAWRRRRKA